MVDVLIATAPGDGDSLEVVNGLRVMGCSAYRWFSSEFCGSSELSCRGSDDRDFGVILSDDAGALDLGKFDVFWNRRMRVPDARLPDAPDDRAQTLKERQSFLDGVYYYLDATKRCINPYSSILQAKSKLIQLMVAKKVGLAVAETLMGNSLDYAREFANKHNDIVFKSFNHMLWRENGKLFLLYTRKITSADLEGTPDVRMMPQIFQRNVAKSYEVRSFFMGSECVSVKIAGPGGRSVQDWRALEPQQMNTNVYDLPEAVRRKCVELLKLLGLQTGSFDFIVDEDGRYIFLEINQAGQFLFLENHCPETRMLDRFCQFLIHPGDPFDFRFDATAAMLRTEKLCNHAAEVANIETERYDTSVFI